MTLPDKLRELIIALKQCDGGLSKDAEDTLRQAIHRLERKLRKRNRKSAMQHNLLAMHMRTRRGGLGMTKDTTIKRLTKERDEAMQRIAELEEVAGWAQAVLTALNVGDIKSESLLHRKLREVMIAFRAAKAMEGQES